MYLEAIEQQLVIGKVITPRAFKHLMNLPVNHDTMKCLDDC